MSQASKVLFLGAFALVATHALAETMSFPRATREEVVRLCEVFAEDNTEPGRHPEARAACEKRLWSDRYLEARVERIDRSYLQHKLVYLQRHRPNGDFLQEMDSPTLGRARHAKKLLDFCGSLKNNFQYSWCTSLVSDPKNTGEVIELCRPYTAATRETQLDEPNLSQFKTCVRAAAQLSLNTYTRKALAVCARMTKAQRADCIAEAQFAKGAPSLAECRRELDDLRVQFSYAKENHKIQNALQELSRSIEQTERILNDRPLR